MTGKFDPNRTDLDLNIVIVPFRFVFLDVSRLSRHSARSWFRFDFSSPNRRWQIACKYCYAFLSLQGIAAEGYDNRAMLESELDVRGVK